MDARTLIDGAIKLAKLAAPLIPGLAQGAVIAEKITGIFDVLQDKALPAQQEQMQAARKTLAAAVTAKAKAESTALRG